MISINLYDLIILIKISKNIIIIMSNQEGLIYERMKKFIHVID